MTDEQDLRDLRERCIRIADSPNRQPDAVVKAARVYFEFITGTKTAAVLAAAQLVAAAVNSGS